MKYLTRTKIYIKLDPTKDAKKVYIFCEGQEREKEYFKYFQGLSSNIDIIPIPNENGKSNPFQLKENADKLFFGDELENVSPLYSLSKEYKDEIWFVIDTDHWNEGGKIQILKDYCREKNEVLEQWFIAQSNPSFEIWLYYHFFKLKPESIDVEKSDSFKAFVNTQIKGGFDSRRMPIELENAISNSHNNFETENGQPSIYSTEVYILGNVIHSFVSEQLVEARKKALNVIH